ncbi:MAG TPA: outer membrane protein assembly factor BamD [Candidatus Eisenbacteria bacterium]|nr:outer membrane protein assembly factor BamD [Candidatus Eisenbacteria bacterium]
MNRQTVRWVLIAVGVLAFPHVSPAPLIYHQGEGWSYEKPGESGAWRKTRAKDQLEAAQEAFDKKDYGVALKAARRTVQQWPLSDYAPEAQFLVGRSLEEQKQDEPAFKEYQKLVEKFPKCSKYQEVLQRQFEIANRYLNGQWFKLWGYVPVFPFLTRDRVVKMYGELVKNGPYSDVAAEAQLKLGAAHEKYSEFSDAVKAYEKAADRYVDRKTVAADALFKAGLAYQKQAQTAEYDQGIATKAISAFTDFMALYPNEPRVPEAQKIIDSLKTEQSRGAFEIAKFYEKRKQWSGALVYYNEVLIKDPNSTYAAEAKQHIETLKARLGVESPQK